MVSLRPCGTRTGCKSGSLVLDQVVRLAQKILLYMRTGLTSW